MFIKISSFLFSPSSSFNCFNKELANLLPAESYSSKHLDLSVWAKSIFSLYQVLINYFPGVGILACTQTVTVRSQFSALEVRMSCVNIRYTLLFLNYLWFMALLPLLAGTIYVLICRDQYFLSSPSDDLSAPTKLLLLLLGSLLPLTLLTSLGWAGPALKSRYAAKSWYLLLTYTSVLVCVILICIAASNSPDTEKWLAETLTQTLRDNMKTYNELENTFSVRFWRSIQTRYECCGLNSSGDWLEAIQKVPSSCQKEFLNKGCLESFSGLRQCWSLEECDEKFLWVQFLYILHLPFMVLNLILAIFVLMRIENGMAKGGSQTKTPP